MSRVRLYRVDSIVLRQRSLGEADRIVCLLTREKGKLSAVAKGLKRPRSKLASGLQLFSYSRVQLACGRSLEVVTQAQVIDTFYQLRTDLDRYAHACYVVELVEALMEEGAPEAGVFRLTLEALQGLNRGGDPATLTRGLELKLLSRLGFGPELSSCVVCGEKVGGKEAGFSAPQGGVVCAVCRREHGIVSISAASLKAMRELGKMPVEEMAERRLNAAASAELARLLRAFVDYRVDRKLESAAFLQRGNG